MAGAAALAAKKHMMDKLVRKQHELTTKVVHKLLSKVGCPKRRRLFKGKNYFKAKLKKLVCKVVAKACNPACSAVVSAASQAALSMGIPIACIQDGLRKACMNERHHFCH